MPRTPTPIPALPGPESATVSLPPEAVAHFSWIANATDVRLAIVHRDHDRWLNLPNADLWAEEFAERTAEMAAIWAEIQRRTSLAEHRLEDAA